MEKQIEISGAGPSGLVAALTVAKSGRSVVVHEHNAEVGSRFHGDFQGLENWTTQEDVLEELQRVGIDPSFEHTAFRDLTVFDPEGREHVFHTSHPLFYLVRRGAVSGTLDGSLKEQALAAGVEIRFKDPSEHMPQGGIAAIGPRGSDAMAVGYVFETNMADAAFGAVSERLAPKGYSYALICKGRGTVASCLFEDYHREKDYVARTVEFFKAKIGLRMTNERHFGGIGNFMVPRTARKGRTIYVGEAAGFQDALWGFGMRYAMLSGHLAAKSVLDGSVQEYDSHWQKRLGGQLRASIVNRYLYEKLGDGGYTTLLHHADEGADPRGWLREYYAETWWKSLMFPVARRAVRTSRKEAACKMEGCDCTWCRCQHDLGKAPRAA
jgi:flavin-dependent dehydrogenase